MRKPAVELQWNDSTRANPISRNDAARMIRGARRNVRGVAKYRAGEFTLGLVGQDITATIRRAA